MNHHTTSIQNRLTALAACAVLVVITACESQLPTSGNAGQAATSTQQPSRSVAGNDAQFVYIDSMRAAEEGQSRVGDAVPVRELVASVVDVRADAKSIRQRTSGSIKVEALRPPTVPSPPRR